MNRTEAFMLPVVPLITGLPVIDARGIGGTVIETWFSSEAKVTMVRVARVRRWDNSIRDFSYHIDDVRVDIEHPLGYSYLLQEYLRRVNGGRAATKAYAWTWGGLHDQAFKFWAAATTSEDRSKLVDRLLKTTNTQEH